MAVTDIDSLKQRASQVRDETANGANTANRRGGLMFDMADTLVTRYGITELLGINESDLNTQTRVGVYKYSIMKSGASKTDYGLLFVYSSDVPTSGSGDYPLYQTRFQDGKMQTRSRTMPNGLWSDWQEIGGVGKPGTGENSEVFNDMENNQAAGDCAHAEGGDTKAQGDRSHAEGTTTTAAGYASHSEGSAATTARTPARPRPCRRW